MASAGAGFIYCMENNHPDYRHYLKIGYTHRFPHDRCRELSKKYQCKFIVLWDLEVYDPERAESFLQEVLHKRRVKWEFFAIDLATVQNLAEKYFDHTWREIEDQGNEPQSLVELADSDSRGFLLGPAPLEEPEVSRIVPIDTIDTWP